MPEKSGNLYSQIRSVSGLALHSKFHVGSPVTKISPEGGALAHPLFKRAAERAASSVFESAPEESTAEYKAGQCASVPQASEAATVFESRPSQRGHADAGGYGYAGETAAARALIEQAAAAAPTVFESQPQRRSADASAAESVAVASGVNAASMAWESQPEASKADVLHRNGPQTSDAEKLIQSAAEQWSSGGDIVYENAPAESSAHVTHASAVQATSASVFESTPSLSQADAVAAHFCHTESARRLIEAAAQQAEKNQLREFSEDSKVREAAELLQQAALEHAQGNEGSSFVFESVPKESSAHARHGADSVEESEEEVTDDED